MNSYRIKIALFPDGERLPMLLDHSGMPVLEATLFSISEIRSRNRAANTISNALYDLRMFYLFLERNEINLRQRLRAGRILEIHEIDALKHFFQRKSCSLPQSNEPPARHRSQNQEVLRAIAIPKEFETVSAATCAIRMITAREYLDWMVWQTTRSVSENTLRSLRSELVEVRLAIDSRIPKDVFAPQIRMGLKDEEIALADATFRIDSPKNPWKDRHARIRNRLIYLLLKYLGPRRGEIAGLRVSQIDFRQGRLLIARQADAIDDPRLRQPNAKTLARFLDFSEELHRLLFDYIMVERRQVMKERRKRTGAEDHGILLVATRTGEPISERAINKLFEWARKNTSHLAPDITPHKLRHTANDLFSAEMDRNKIPPDEEIKLRNQRFGWKDNSKMGVLYTKRHTERKTREVSLSMQKRIFEAGATNE